MSRRFGRNQKRALRTRVAELERAAAVTRQDWVHQRRQIDLLTSFFDEVLRILGPNSIFNPYPNTTRPGNTYGDHVRVPDPVPMLPGALVNEYTFARVLHFLGTEVGTRYDGAMHIRAELLGKRVVYCLSAEAVAVLPKDVLVDRLTREISRQLAHQLATELKG